MKNLAEILKAQIYINNQDFKISYNKILAKADANVKILYLTEDNEIKMQEAVIPIMGFIDMPNISEEHLCELNYCLSNLVIKPNSQEEHSIYIEAEINLSCMVYENKEVELIQDLYSPSKCLEFKQKEIKTQITPINPLSIFFCFIFVSSFQNIINFYIIFITGNLIGFNLFPFFN